MKFNRLKETRQIANKSLQEVADFLKISVRTYMLYESGKRSLSSESYRSLASFYGVDLDYLMGADLINYAAEDSQNYAKTEEERELLRLFRNLSPYLQDLTLSNVRSWSNSATMVYTKRLK